MSARSPEEDLESQLSGHMSFLDHLEELRSRILRSLIAIGVAFGVCWVFVEDIFQFLSYPVLTALEESGAGNQQLIFTDATGGFTILIKTAFFAAILLASPFILAQVWLFIAPGLYRHERRYAIPFVLFGTVLAFLGAAFGYYIAFPRTLEFLFRMGQQAGMAPFIDGPRYFNFFLAIEVGLAVVFQIPPIVFVMTRMGLVTPGFLLRNTQYAVLIALIVAAIITPTGDIPTMMLFAGPMILLYLIGVMVSYVVGWKRKKSKD